MHCVSLPSTYYYSLASLYTMSYFSCFPRLAHKHLCCGLAEWQMLLGSYHVIVVILALAVHAWISAFNLLCFGACTVYAHCYQIVLCCLCTEQLLLFHLHTKVLHEKGSQISLSLANIAQHSVIGVRVRGKLRDAKRWAELSLLIVSNLIGRAVYS